MYFIASGAKHHMDLFETHMQSQVVTVNGIAADGTNIHQKIFGMLQPVKLYRYVIPKEVVPAALKTLRADQKNPNIPSLAKFGLKKALGLNDVSKYEISDVTMNVNTDFVNLEVLGVRDDPTRIVLNGVKQEAI